MEEGGAAHNVHLLATAVMLMRICSTPLLLLLLLLLLSCCKALARCHRFVLCALRHAKLMLRCICENTACTSIQAAASPHCIAVSQSDSTLKCAQHSLT
jgi:hypothetical protein